MHDPRSYPLELDLDRDECLRIRFADGVQREIPLGILRRQCPCASCRTEREKQNDNPLRVLPVRASEREMTTARTAQVLGTYAVKITWNDGHDTGIYDFVYLRELSDACAGGDVGVAS